MPLEVTFEQDLETQQKKKTTNQKGSNTETIRSNIHVYSIVFFQRLHYGHVTKQNPLKKSVSIKINDS